MAIIDAGLTDDLKMVFGEHREENGKHYILSKHDGKEYEIFPDSFNSFEEHKHNTLELDALGIDHKDTKPISNKRVSKSWKRALNQNTEG